MPATAANAHPERRAASVASIRPAQPSASPSPGEPNKVRTRSANDVQTQGKTQTDYVEARKFLNGVHLLVEGAPCTTQSLICVLLLLAKTCKMPENVAKAISHIAELLQQVEHQRNKGESVKSIQEIVKELQSNLSAEMDSKLNELEKKLTLPSLAQKQLESTAKELGLAAESIKVSTSDIGKTIAQATDTNSQLANAATDYRDALLKSNEDQTRTRSQDNPTHTHADPRILRDVERKARQILIDTTDPRITEASLAEIKEKVSNAIKSIADPSQPKEVSVTEVIKLRKGGFTVIFKDKETVNWLQDADLASKFTTAIATDASITKRVFPILAPRVQLTFDPSVDRHLREIEECNNLPFGTIEKARWIKPENRRAPGQMAAHAILTITDIDIANACIRDGITICGLRIRPSRLKHEPMQCMKCRRWGHFASACLATADLCGTCGGDHRTNACNNRDKKYCVSCKANDHASWDRECPVFRRRCDQFDENFPENNLPYFPTGEEWTLAPRPSKIQRADKFPARYTVNPLQPPEQTNRAQVNKPQGKQRKQQGAKTPANQYTMDRYVGPGAGYPQNTGANPGLNPNDANNADAAASLRHNTEYNPSFTDNGLEPHGWN